MPIGIPLSAVWEFDSSAGAYVDNTIEAQTDAGTAFELLGQAADFHYFGFNRRIDALMFVLSNPGSYGALTWAYGASVSSWIRFVPVQEFNLDQTNDYMLWEPKEGALETAWASFAFTGAAPHAAAAPDSTARFWIRVSAASVTSIATCNSVVCRPYVSYATAADVQRQLQLNTAFTASTTPSLFTIEDYLRGVEDELIYQMGESWRPEFLENELVDFNQYGMKLRYEPVITVYELAVYGGSTFDVKVEGRTDDFHVEPRTGMIYVSTIFLDAIPPTFRRSYSARRDQGAFKRAVRVRYSHGHDIRRHILGHRLNRIATYKAAADFVSNEDFSPLIPLGLDTISLETKYNNWMIEYNAFVDKYSKIRVY